MITEGSWERTLQAIKEQFEIYNLLPEHENLLREFLVGRNIFVNLLTGCGKSFDFPVPPNCGGHSFRKALWFQCYHGDITVAISYGRPGFVTSMTLEFQHTFFDIGAS